MRLVASTTGETNFLIIMWLRTVADVLTAEFCIQKRLPEVKFVQSTVVMRSAKRMGFMLDAERRQQVRSWPALASPDQQLPWESGWWSVLPSKVLTCWLLRVHRSD